MENEAKLTEINGRLRNAYKPYLQYLQNEFSSDADKISFPLFMKVSPSYFNGKHKILFVGKEVGEWYGTISQENTDVDKIMDIYPQAKLCSEKEGPFWNFIRHLNDGMNGSPCSGFMWTTFSKFTFQRETPPPEIQNRNNEGFELLRQEIEILRPDMVFFLTGFSYDEQMRHVFKDICYEKIQNNVMYKIKHELLPAKSMVLLHPKAMIERGIMDEVLSVILKDIPVLQE